MYVNRGNEKTDNFIFKEQIISGCLKVFHEYFANILSTEKNITLDCDAFSILIIAKEMNAETKHVIKCFLFLFGTLLSSISIPSQSIGAKKVDSIFGSPRSVGCQHLESKSIGNYFMKGETLVITDPIKIAVHHTCRKMIIAKLAEYPSQYPMDISGNIDICFDPNMASNTPPYGVMVDTILDCSKINELGVYVIHVADIGTRHRMKIDDDECPIQIMFDNIKKMRNTADVTAELCQIDFAFTLPTKQNHLIQCSHEKLKKNVKKDSCVDSMTTEHWALHGIHTKDGKVVSKQRGSVRMKTTNYTESSIIKIPLGYNDECSENLSDTSDATYADNSPPQLPTIVSQVYHDSSNVKSSTEVISMDSKSVYSVKIYPDGSHYLTQRRSKIPLSYDKMRDFHTSSMLALQRFFQLLLRISGGFMKSVQENGICTRFEVSVRPSCHSNVGNLLRCRGHLIDMLAHVFIVIHELFQRQKHKLSIYTTPYELVYTKALSLIDQAQSLTRFRSSVRFCDVYTSVKCSDWLRAIVVTILTYIGLSGETKLKFLVKWLKDEKRYNPTNQSPQMMTDLCMNDHSLHIPIKPSEISPLTWIVIQKILTTHQFSKKIISIIINILKTDKPLSHSRKLLQSMSLSEKWDFAQKIFHHVIPILVTYQKNEDGKTDENPSIIQSSNSYVRNYWEDRDDLHNYLVDSFHPQNFVPPDMVYSLCILNFFEDHSAIPKTKQKWQKKHPQDPFMNIILKLADLTLIFDVYTPVYVKYLYQFIKLCHTRELELHNDGHFLRPLDSNGQNSSFQYACKCLNENYSDAISLQKICYGLGVTILDCSGPVTGEILIASLCHHYFFPCQLMSSYPNAIPNSNSTEHGRILNNLIHETFKSEIVIVMKSHVPYKSHFYRFFQDEHIWIYKTIFSGPNIVNNFNNSTVDFVSNEDLYVVVDQCFNSHGICGDDIRMNLHSLLYKISISDCLCDNFLLQDAKNNNHFCQSKTLSELESAKGFMLLEKEDTSEEILFKIYPDIILPCVSLLYKSNILFIDLHNNESHFHFFEKNSGKVVTYSTKDLTKSPWMKLNYYTFLYVNGIFKFINFPINQEQVMISSPNSSNLLFMMNAQTHSTLSKHPNGRLCKANSIADSLIGILTSENINHEHFRQHQKQDDILDVRGYLVELVSSYSDKSLSFFFGAIVVTLLRVAGVMTLPSLLDRIQTEYIKLPHNILCPLMCLKYKLWISVWEDNIDTSKKSKKSRKTFLYWYDASNDIVDCKEMQGYVHLPCQSHIIYIRSSSSNLFGYWNQDQSNAFNDSDLYNYCVNIQSKYSYLDGPLKSKVMELFMNYLKMKIISDEENNYNSRLNFHGNNINSSLVPILFTNDDLTFQQHGLLVIFPFNEEENKFFGCLIHSDISLDIVNQRLSDIKRKLNDQTLAPIYSFQHISIHQHSDFASSILLPVHMYIAHCSRNVEELKCNLEILKLERDIVNKSKSWIYDMLSDDAEDADDILSILTIPQWLKQIISNLNAPSHGIQTVLTPPTDRITNIPNGSLLSQAPTFNVENINPHVGKRKRKYEESFQMSSILNPASNHNTELYINFFASVKKKAILQQENNKEERKLKKLNSLRLQQNQEPFEIPWNVEKFVVATTSCKRNSIYALNFIDLINDAWLSDEIIDFMSNVFIEDHDNIHVYTTHFMSALMSNTFSCVSNYHKKITSDVNFLYIPIHQNNNHWLLSRLDFRQKRISLWNSSTNTKDNSNLLKCLKRYVHDVNDSFFKKNKQWYGIWTMEDKTNNCPTQDNFDDCGIFTILNMYHLINGLVLSDICYSQELIDKHQTRKRIAQIIHQTSDQYNKITI